MNLETSLFFLLLSNAILHLFQVFIYGFKEHNRPTVLFGVVFLFLAFAISKDEAWIKWAAIIVPFTGFIGVLNGFSDSLKPNWLNYLMVFLNLVLTLTAIVYKIN